MQRRKRTSPAEGFIDLAARLRWWLFMNLAVVSHFAFHAYAISPPPVVMSGADLGNALIQMMLRSADMVAQYAVPILLTVGAGCISRRLFMAAKPLRAAR